ncbi:MAG: outer membrane protein transport protein [Bacteroidaceae bacterium]|nr:outer membrane protein transport protein [Bacteroidaceae bacterium]
MNCTLLRRHAVRISFFFLSALLSTNLTAQTNGSNSPYSRYGFGLLSDGAQSFNKGMAGVGYAMSDGEQLNFKNPATFALTDSASFLFDIGFTLQNANIGTKGNRVNARNARVDYAAAAFRMLPGFGLSVGLRPYSTIGYNLSGTSTFERAGVDVTQTETYDGDGGLREVYGGLAFAPLHGDKQRLSAGVSVGYLWGELDHSVQMSFSDATIYSRNREYKSHISTYKLDFGLLFEQRLSAKSKASIGLVYGLGHNIGSRAEYYDQQKNGTTVVSADTQRVASAYSLPHTFGAGLGWNYRDRLRVGFDYTWQKWSDVTSPILSGNTYITSKGQLKDRHSFSLGAEYQPNPRSNYWRHHLRYRAGVTYSTPYIKVNGEDGPSEYGFSAGVSLPITSLHNQFDNIPYLHLSAGFRRVQPKHSWQVAENYMWVSVGLTFNGSWFQKSHVY